MAIVATDLSQPMLDFAAMLGTQRSVEWQCADAMQLPFPENSFDALACQFGVMFFADKSRAFAEARRVLRPGGIFLFNVWDRIEENEIAHTVTSALETVFPLQSPRFLARVPHGYYDPVTIAGDLAAGGFVATPQFVTLAARGRARTCRDAAIGYCQGTPLRSEIEALDSTRLDAATHIVAEAIAHRFGREGVDGKIQAHIVSIENG